MREETRRNIHALMYIITPVLILVLLLVLIFGSWNKKLAVIGFFLVIILIAKIQDHRWYRRGVYYNLSGKWERSKEGRAFVGELLGRSYRILPKSSQFEITTPIAQKFWLRLLKDTDPYIKKDEIQLGVHVLDYPYVIHSNAPEISQHFLKLDEIRSDFLKLQGFRRFEILRGKAQLDIAYPKRSSPFNATEILETFFRILQGYEQLLLIEISSISTNNSRLCPFCRGEFNQELWNVSCKNCGTIHHQNCWQENGQCTTWGCSSKVCV